MSQSCEIIYNFDTIEYGFIEIMSKIKLIFFFSFTKTFGKKVRKSTI